MFSFAPIVFFALGAVVASFIGVLVARLHTGQGFLVGRSHCDVCNTPLPLAALVPLFSYVIGQGRARCCGATISPTAPVTELLLGGLFALAQYQIGFSAGLACMLIALSLLLALVLYDLNHQILPPTLLALFVVVSSATGFFLTPSPAIFIGDVIVAFGLASLLALIHFLSRGRAMGFADAPLAFGLALLVGPAAFSGFVFSFWIGAAVGIIILARRPRGSRIRVEVPFAPFLAAGFLLAYFTQWNPFIFAAAFSVH